MINETTLIVILIAFLFIILMSMWNGFVIRWDWATGEDKKKLSTIWHIIGFGIRALPLIPAWWFFWGQWYDLILVTLLYFNFSWTIFDATIALIFGKPIWFTGNTAKIDRAGKIGWVLKGILFLATVTYVIFHIVMVSRLYIG